MKTWQRITALCLGTLMASSLGSGQADDKSSLTIDAAGKAPTIHLMVNGQMAEFLVDTSLGNFVMINPGFLAELNPEKPDFAADGRIELSVDGKKFPASRWSLDFELPDGPSWSNSALSFGLDFRRGYDGTIGLAALPADRIVFEIGGDGENQIDQIYKPVKDSYWRRRPQFPGFVVSDESLDFMITFHQEDTVSSKGATILLEEDERVQRNGVYAPVERVFGLEALAAPYHLKETTIALGGELSQFRGSLHVEDAKRRNEGKAVRRLKRDKNAPTVIYLGRDHFAECKSITFHIEKEELETICPSS